MIKNIEELKELILFCKKEKVSEVSIGDTTIKLSELAILGDIQSVQDMENKLTSLGSSTLTESLDDITKKDLTTEEEEALFWSSNT